MKAHLLDPGAPGSNEPSGRLRTRSRSLPPILRRSTQVFVAALTAIGLLGMAYAGFASEAPSSTNPTVRVLVVYYSLTGNTEQMAQGVVTGINRVPKAIASLKKVEDIAKQDLEAADAIILGCPTYFGDVPGKMKSLMDDWNWTLKVDFTDKVGGAFATGGGQVGGKEHTVISLLIFMLQNRMIVAGTLYENPTTGSVWGEVGAAAMTGPLDPGVGEQELDSAHRLGERIARLAVRMKSPQRPAASTGIRIE